MTLLPLSPYCSDRAPRRRGAPRASASTRRGVAGRLCLLPCLLLAGACDTPAPPQEVAIGVGALPGEPGYANVVRGVELAIATLNAAPGVRFRIALPADSVRSAVAIAEAHRSDPAVLAVVGHPTSGHTLLALPVYAAAESGGTGALALVSPTASSPGLSGVSPWFFRVAPSDAATARTVARYALDSLDATTAAVIYRNDAYGRDWTAAFAESWRQGGGATVLRDPYLTDLSDWSLYAAHVAERDPDVVLFPGDGTDALAFLTALRAVGVDAPFIGGDGTALLAEHPTLRNARYVSFYEADHVDTPEAKAFLEAWRTGTSTPPDMFAALAFDAALAIGSAVRTTAVLTRTGVRDALEAVVRTGTTGPIAFDPVTHDITGRDVAVVTVGTTTRARPAIASAP